MKDGENVGGRSFGGGGWQQGTWPLVQRESERERKSGVGDGDSDGGGAAEINH